MPSPSPGASPEVPFTPRKEFISDQPTQPSSFALLALSSANCIRLYSFAPPAVTALRRLFERYIILTFREDASQNLVEFALDAKPWSNPKSVPTEKLLVDIIAIIYQCGYQYLSTIDYGREADDRLAMAFSKPTTANRAPTPLPPSLAPKPDSTSSSSMTDKARVNRVPFAISFASVTVMRVIAPPLHLTPAILQAVRGSWPRGVVAEKKVGENSYEFKLKGYRWFQQDTFATDSLQHILSLLTSLDAHSFTLLTSVSLTNRSRVKDLWVFTGPAPENPLEPNPSSSTPTGSYGDLSLNPGTQYQHRRLATDPAPVIPHSPTTQHPRAATDGLQRPRLPSQSQPSVLRKPAPRAQIPVSVARDSYAPEELPVYRANMPSTVPSDVENMTGVGASPNVFYSTSPYDAAMSDAPPSSMPSPEFVGAPDHNQSYFGPHDREPTPPIPAPSTSSAPATPHQATPPSNDTRHYSPSAGDSDFGSKSAPLLAIGTFRDSAFSSNSEISCEIPIKWTGPFKEEIQADQQRARSKLHHVSSSGPQLPGGWQPTPIEEKAEEEVAVQNSEPTTTPIHEMLSRIESPEIVPPDEIRKSEAALVGIIQSTSPMPPMPQQHGSQGSGTKVVTPGGQGQGWVLVNVENSNSSTPTESAHTPANGESTAKLSDPSTTPMATPAVPSPAAKAIVVIDAMESKHRKSRSTAIAKESGEGGSSGVRRFFSLNRKNSRKALVDNDARQRNGTERAPTSIPRSNLRDKLRRIGTPEAARREDKRRSID